MTSHQAVNFGISPLVGRLTAVVNQLLGALANHVLAAIVATLGANRVINMPCAAVAALRDGGSNSHVVGATLGRTGLGLSTFRMCHCCLLFVVIVFD